MMPKYSLPVLLLLCLLMLVSCASETASDDTAAPADTTTAEVTEAAEETIPAPELPTKDYEGDDFIFLVRSPEASSYSEKNVYTAEMDGEVVNDAVFERNSKLQEKYNINIGIIEVADDENEYTVAQQYVLAGDNAFDAISARGNLVSQMAKAKLLIDWNELNYVTLDAEYWNANAADQLEIGGRLYMMPGDINTAALGGARMLYFNKKLLNDYGLDDPYELVYADKWVMDTFIEMVSQVSSDLNGDGVYDDKDLYGMLSETGAQNGNIIHFYAASNMFQVIEQDGKLIPNVNTEKSQSLMEKLYSVLIESGNAIDYETLGKTADIGDEPHIYNYARKKLFTNDQFLFVQNGIGIMHQFSDMESDFGVVPNPKYDEAQENYHHLVDKYALLFAIPVTVSDLEQVDIILEDMAYLSNGTVIPAYYETNILQKKIRDDTAVEMLDVIKGSMHYDIAMIYELGLSDVLWNAFNAGGTLASTYASSESSILTNIDKLLESFAE